jgi:pyruvate dehydrogenase E1 component
MDGALEGVINQEGAERAHFLIEKVIGQARLKPASTSLTRPTPNTSTPFRSTSSPSTRATRHGNQDSLLHPLERHGHGRARQQGHQRRRPHRLLRFCRRALRRRLFAFLARIRPETGGDLIFFQGHSVPGVYSRAFMLGRLSEEQMDNFRQETGGKGISSYPHPWLMPDFWQFPTVSMGLGPIQAIYQARFMKYLDSRGLDARPVIARSGPSSATARPTKSNRSAPSAWPAARSSTT